MMKYLTITILMMSFLYAHPDPKPRVEIVFKIEDPLYKLIFENDLPGMEAEVERKLGPVFNTYLSFIDFSEKAAEDKLTITLHNIFKNNQDFSTPKELVFFFDFTGPNVKSGVESMNWSFQSKVKYGETPFSNADFINSIVSRIRDNLSRQYEFLVGSMFSKFVLTNEALTITSLKGWALPFDSDDLGISNETQFEVEIQKNEILGLATCEYATKVYILRIKPEAQVPEKFKGCFFIRSIDEQDECNIFTSEDVETKINEVTMMVYKRGDIREDQPVTPDNFVPDAN